MSQYVLDTGSDAAVAEHDALGQLLDPFTRMRISSLAPDMDGWACLEVGPGRHGTIARWLADQVGDGLVVAADLTVDHLPAHPRVRPVVHDITKDGAVGGIRQYDLVHARLVLMHIPQRHLVLHRLAGMLTPGGILLVEDWAPRREGWVRHAPTPRGRELVEKIQHALGGIFDAAGVDPQWGEQIHEAMVAEALLDVETVIHDAYWSGTGHPGLRKLAGTIEVLRPRLLETGITEEELSEHDLVLRDPRLILRGHPLYSTSGRRPAR